MRVRWTWPAVVLGVALVAALVAASGSPVAVLGGLALFVLSVGAVVQTILWRRDRRRLVSTLQQGQWTLVNVVVLSDLMGGPGAHAGETVVAIIDPATGDVRGTLLPLTSSNRWPGHDVRRWAWLVAAPGGKYAAIAAVDRSVVLGLRTGNWSKKSIHDHAQNVLRAAELPPAVGGQPMPPIEVGVLHPAGESERWPNRPMPATARVLIVAVLAILSVATIASDTIAHRAKVEHRRDLVQNGDQATAEVISYRSGGKDPGEITIRITDGPYAGATGTRTVYGGPHLAPGAEVTVFHAPGDVDDLYIAGYDEDARYGGLFVSAVTVVIALTLWKSHRRGPQGPGSVESNRTGDRLDPV